MFEGAILEIDEQVAKLQQAKALLAGISAIPARRGRPAATTKLPTSAIRKRTKLSAAGRKAIAEAQKKRWAAIKAATKSK